MKPVLVIEQSNFFQMIGSKISSFLDDLFPEEIFLENFTLQSHPHQLSLVSNWAKTNRIPISELSKSDQRGMVTFYERPKLSTLERLSQPTRPVLIIRNNKFVGDGATKEIKGEK